MIPWKASAGRPYDVVSGHLYSTVWRPDTGRFHHLVALRSADFFEQVMDDPLVWRIDDVWYRQTIDTEQ
jgi:hypothetical protein